MAGPMVLMEMVIELTMIKVWRLYRDPMDICVVMAGPWMRVRMDIKFSPRLVSPNLSVSPGAIN